MDNVESYEVQAQQVMSDLKNAVGVADDRLIHLQQEIDNLANKAKISDYPWKKSDYTESTSSIDDEDIAKYLEEFADHSVDGSLPSIHSSQSRTIKKDRSDASTKMFDDLEKSSEFQCPSDSQRANDGAHTTNHFIKHNPGYSEPSKNLVSFGKKTSSNEKHLVNGDFREDVSSEPSPREKLFRNMLHVSGKKYNSTPKEKAKATENRMEVKADDDKTNFETCSEYSEGKVKKETNQDMEKFLIPDFTDFNTEERYFKPIRPELLSSRSDGDHKERLIIAKNEAEEQNKLLLEKLSTEKEKNEKLTEKFKALEDDFKDLQIKYELKKQERMTQNVTALVNKIQHAQKLREHAMLDRLRIAASDRDEALMRAKAFHAKNEHLLRSSKGNLYRDGDTSLDEIVDSIASADSARVIEKYGNELVERMRNLKNARTRITSEEMSAVIKERDDAITKCHCLQQELQNCIEELNLLKQSKDTSVSVSLKAKVRSTQEESAKTQERLHTAEEEIQMLRIYYSLHKSLTLAQDKDLADKYNQYMTDIREEAMKKVKEARKMEIESHQLRDKLLSVTQEKNARDNENRMLHSEIQHLRDKCSKLERLVKVLRRKLTTPMH